MSILLVGTGYMGKEYAKVLKAMKLPFFAVGRSKNSSDSFTTEIKIKAESGGVDNWLKKNKFPSKAIVAVTEDQLGITTRQLIKAGCKEILVEKPGGFDLKDIKQVAAKAKKYKARARQIIINSLVSPCPTSPIFQTLKRTMKIIPAPKNML